jgi:hypothetical protein
MNTILSEEVPKIDPKYTTVKTIQQMEEDMKLATQKEMEKLSSTMRERLSAPQKPFEIEESFLPDSDDEDDDIEISEDEKQILFSINGLNSLSKKTKGDKKKQHAKPKQEHNLINNVIMVEKLKNEIDKLENRIRYKDLDISNLNVDNLKLKSYVDKQKLFDQIMKELNEREMKINDFHKLYLNAKSNNSSKIVIFQLSELQKLFELMKKYTDMNEINQQLDKFGDPIFKRLITGKTDSIIHEYEVTHTSINYDLENTEQWLVMVEYFYIFLLGLCVVGILYFVICNLI